MRRQNGDQWDQAVITSASNLALIYTSQGRLNEAENLYVDVLEQCKRILGQYHADTFKAMSNLSLVYHRQGRWHEADRLKRELSGLYM